MFSSAQWTRQKMFPWLKKERDDYLKMQMKFLSLTTVKIEY